MTKSKWFGLAILFASTFGTITFASASGPLNYLGRMFGAGWSDGYHAEDWKFQNRGYPGCAPMSAAPMSYYGPALTTPPPQHGIRTIHQMPAHQVPAQPTPAAPRSVLPPGTPVRPQ